MSTSIYSALSGLQVKETELEVVANNLANVNTNAFKEQELAFEAVLARYQPAGQSETPYTRIAQSVRNFEQGATVDTNSALDVAIQGDGFFEIQTPNGTLYTRDGAFALNEKGELVNTRGHAVAGSQGTLTVGRGGTITISSSGKISVDGEDKGNIKVVQFTDPSQLEAVGGNYFRASSATQKPATQFGIMQGKIETSNANVVHNLVKLIEVSRMVGSYQQVLKNQSEMDRQAIQSMGQTG